MDISDVSQQGEQHRSSIWHTDCLMLAEFNFCGKKKMDNLALSNVLTTPAAVVASTNSQVPTAPADAAVETPFGDVLARQLAMADAKQANPKDITALLVDARELLPQPSSPVQPLDIIQQIAVDPALVAQQAATAGQVLPKEALIDTLKKAGKSDSVEVSSEPLAGQQLTEQQGATPVIASFQVAGNLQPGVAALEVPGGKELPVSGIAASTAGSLDAVIANAKPLVSGENIDADSAKASASFAARLESALAADGVKPNFSDLAGGSHALNAVVEKTAVAAPTSAGIPQQVGSPHWETGLGDKVVWMIGSQTQSAQLHLNPPNLGPLEIKLSMADGQASLSFVTQHAAVRDAIEAASPRLRDMMGESGISMGSVSVNVGSFSQQQQAFQQNNSSGSSRQGGSVDADVAEPIAVSVQSLDEQGLVNLFA